MALRQAMRTLGVSSTADLAAWMVRDGLPEVSPGAYLHRDAQERVVEAMAATNGGVRALEAAFPAAALHFGRNLDAIPAQLPRVPRSQNQRSSRRAGRSDIAAAPTRGAGSRQMAARTQDAGCPYPTQEAERHEGAGIQSGATESALPQRGRNSGDPPERWWSQLGSIDLASEVRLPVATLQNVPRVLRGRMRHAWGIGLRRLCAVQEAQRPSEDAQVRAWTLILLLPRMLLHRPRSERHVPWEDLCRRFERFEKGEWLGLLADTHPNAQTGCQNRNPGTQQREARLEQAQKKVQLGEPSHARQVLTAQALAPGTPATLQTLQSRRPTQGEDLPEDVRRTDPGVRLNFESRRFLENLRSASRGVAGGPAGGRNEHYQVCLDDERVAQLLAKAASFLAHAAVPEAVMQAVRQSRLTALLKKDGGIRGIATGDTLRRLVARTLAQTYGEEMEKACAPFQFALSTRAGTDCVGHIARAATELEDDLVLVSLDGIGAYDHIKRSSMLSKLRQLPTAQAILPFVLMFYGSSSTYTWYDDDGVPHDVHQAEGGEQGDPLMPVLYALGQHEALQAARSELHESDVLLAFLDDLYLLTTRDRVTEAIRLVTSKVAEMAGVQPHLGKLEVWSAAGGPAPAGLREQYPSAWKGDLPEVTSV